MKSALLDELIELIRLAAMVVAELMQHLLEKLK